MARREALDRAYMQCAFAIAELSQAKRKKVGAIIVAHGGGIIAEGFNGTPAGFDNNCEELIIECQHLWWENIEKQYFECSKCKEQVTVQQVYFDYNKDYRNIPNKTSLKTKPEVLHAESNAIMKVARSNNSSNGATLYCTLMPCFECSKLIIQAGIARVVYAEQYPYAGHIGTIRPLGLELLQRAMIPVDKLGGFTEY